MLELLKIQNLAVIQSAEVPFEKGLNILSGETGAGKSIILEAISLLLGSRASTDLIREGSEEARVEGVFNLKGSREIQARAESLGFSFEGTELIIRRTINRAGKHRIFINGSVATLGALQEISEGLVDLCSQQEHQSLFKTPYLVEMIDQFANLEKEASLVRSGFEEWKSLTREKTEIEATSEERARRASFLSFQLEELKNHLPKKGEEEELQTEKKRLQSGEERMRFSERARVAIEEEGGALSSLRDVKQALQSLSALDPESTEFLNHVDEALPKLEDLGLSITRYASKVEMDPERLPIIQERLSELLDLKRKYGAQILEDPEALISGLEKEFESVQGTEEKLEKLSSKIAELEKTLSGQGKSLFLKREKASKEISKAVTKELQELRMESAKFRVALIGPLPLNEWTESSLSTGIAILVQTNAGEGEKALSKVASGGEISRIMLAVRRVVSNQGGIGVYLFDEIDAGIGGQTAFVVGRKLQSVAKHHQVICITHVPQVAAFANHHLSIQKSVRAGRTLTEVLSLDRKNRDEELARMLGGSKLTRASLESAKELIRQSKNA